MCAFCRATNTLLMKNTVKTLVLLTTFFISSTSVNAQLKLPVASALASDVKKIIKEYPNHFTALKGEMVAEHPQSTDYRCTLKVSGEEESFITRYSSKKEIYSWQALLLTTESFDKAKQKFRSLYNQLNNLSVQADGLGTLHLKGKYETPDEENKFTSVLFTDENQADETDKLVMELSLQFQIPMEWKVKLMVYGREKEK